MKRTNFILLISLVLLLACSKEETPDLSDQYISIPGQRFEHELLDLGIDSEKVLDGRILRSDALKVKSLTLDGKDNPGRLRIYQDIRGIEYFINLETFIAYNTRQESLNVNSLTKLKHLELIEGHFTSVSFDQCTELEYLKFNNDQNRIENVDVSGNLKLKYISLETMTLKNEMLDLTMLDKLEYLLCGAIRLTEIKTPNDGLPKLEEIRIFAVPGIQSIDLTNSPLLTDAHIQSELSSLDLSQNLLLEDLNLYNVKLTALDVSNNPLLKSIVFRQTGNNLSCIKKANKALSHKLCK